MINITLSTAILKEYMIFVLINQPYIVKRAPFLYVIYKQLFYNVKFYWLQVKVFMLQLATFK